MTPKASSGISFAKVYIVGMMGLIAISLIWIMLNIFFWSQCRMRWKEDREKLTEIQESIKYLKTLPPEEPTAEISDEYKFFLRNFFGDIEKKPELWKGEVSKWEEMSIDNAVFEEKKYVIYFKIELSRNEIAKYIYIIQQDAPYLKLKELVINNNSKDDSRWAVEKIVFAQRRPLQRKRQ